MSFSSEFTEFILYSIPTARVVSGGKMILCRCQYCSDSKDKRSAHFYISIPQSEQELPLYYCHLCHSSGIVTNKTLLQWGIYDDRIALSLIQYNSKAINNPLNLKYKDRSVYKLNNYYVTNDDISKSKLYYLNNRLGISLNYSDLLNMKIVLNLKDILKANKISNLTRHENIVDEFDKYFIGFISMDNSFISLRRTVDKGIVYKGIDSRYQNYNIFGKYDNSERNYAIPTNIDLSIPKRIKVNIAEGQFDILSIYYNLRKDPNQIYISVGGSGHLGIVKYLINVLKIIYVELHIYPDNDKYGSIDVMNSIYEFIKPYNIGLFIHRNVYSGEKDFGVPLCRIDEKIEKLI